MRAYLSLHALEDQEGWTRVEGRLIALFEQIVKMDSEALCASERLICSTASPAGSSKLRAHTPSFSCTTRDRQIQRHRFPVLPVRLSDNEKFVLPVGSLRGVELRGRIWKRASIG